MIYECTVPRRAGRYAALVTATGCLLGPVRGGAQPEPAAASVLPAVSGVFAAGHVSFDRYTTPGACQAAVFDTYAVRTRSLAAQAANEALEAGRYDADTLPAEAVVVAKACAARFTAVGVRPEALPALFVLALLGRNDTLAAAVLDRRLSLAGSDTARQRVLAEAMDAELHAPPPRVAAAEALVPRMTTGGRPDVDAQLRAREMLLGHHLVHADWDRAAVEAERVIAAARDLAPQALAPHAASLVDAYRALLATAWPDSAAMLAVGRRAQADLGRLPQGVDVLPGEAWRTMSPAEFASGVLSPLGGRDGRGRPANPIQADYWFPARRDVSRPVPGRVALALFVYSGCSVAPESACTKEWNRLRRWQEQYGGEGLDLTLVVYTTGEPLGNSMIVPAEEARVLAWYYLEYLKLPVTLAVRAAPMTVLPPPDGRRLNPHRNDYIGNPSAQLTDRLGRLLYAGRSLGIADDNFVSEPWLELLLRRAVEVRARSATVAAPPAPVPPSR